MCVGGEALECGCEDLVGAAGDVGGREHGGGGGDEPLVGRASGRQALADLDCGGCRGGLRGSPGHLDADAVQDDEPLDECVQLWGCLQVGAAQVFRGPRMQPVDGGDHLGELQAQGGESLSLLGADGIGGHGHGRDGEHVDAGRGRQLRSRAPGHGRGDAAAGRERDPDPRRPEDAC